MKYINLTKGYQAIVDDEDYECLNQWKWYFSTGYAMRDIHRKGEEKTILMHRFIANTPKGKVTDHINGNKLDNRKTNLRIATISQNGMNQKVNSLNTSGYKGVSWEKRRQKWQVHVKIQGKSKHIGYFKQIKEAVEAYNDAAKKYFGEYARINIL